MGIAVRLCMFALALSATPAAAQVVNRVGVTGYVAPRCIAAPATAQRNGLQGIASLRCNGAHPALSVSTRKVAGSSATRIVGTGDDGARLMPVGGNWVFDIPQDGDFKAGGSRLEVIVSPVA